MIFSPSVINNLVTQGGIPPTPNTMSTLSSTPVRPPVSRTLLNSLNVTYTTPIMSSTINPNPLDGPLQSTLARNIIQKHRRRELPESHP